MVVPEISEPQHRLPSVVLLIMGTPSKRYLPILGNPQCLARRLLLLSELERLHGPEHARLYALAGGW